jgi:hypothetical protein
MIDPEHGRADESAMPVPLKVKLASGNFSLPPKIENECFTSAAQTASLPVRKTA